MEDETKLAALAQAARALNAAGVLWAVGASALLYFEGVAEEFNDFDLLVFPEHLSAAQKAFATLGAEALPQSAPSKTYATQAFCEYRLNGVDFDLLCNFAIRRKDATYGYPFDETRVSGSIAILGERVPLTPLADWFVLYLLMPGRAKKATLIAHHLKAEPKDSSRAWLNLWLHNRLPGDVREQVFNLYTALAVPAR